VEFGNIAAAVNSKPDNLTVASFQNVNVTGSAIPTNGIYLPATNTLGFSTNGTLWWEITATGALTGIANPALISAPTLSLQAAGVTALNIAATGTVTISAPSSGNALTVNAFAGSPAFIANGTNEVGRLVTSGDVTAGGAVYLRFNDVNGNAGYVGYAGFTASELDLTNLKSGPTNFRNAGGVTLSVASTGAVTINAPSTGNALIVNQATANSITMIVQGGATSGQSYGIRINAGTTSADFPLQINNQTGGTVYLQVSGDGGVTVGSPTGGDKGAGAINASSYFTAGVNNIQTGTFTGTLTGCTTSPTATFNYTIVNGTHCTIDCSAGLTGTSNAATMTITGVAAACTPARTQLLATAVENNTAFQVGFAQISGTTLTFGAGIAAFTGGFTATASTKGIGAGWSMSFPIA
jgi:hypothetical protein